MTEKILASRSGNGNVKPGDNIWTQVDKLMTHDVCGPGTFGIFQKEFGPNAQVWDPERVVIIPDHYIFTSDSRANRNVDILRCPHGGLRGQGACPPNRRIARLAWVGRVGHTRCRHTRYPTCWAKPAMR
jgi:hypothetical protein